MTVALISLEANLQHQLTHEVTLLEILVLYTYLRASLLCLRFDATLLTGNRGQGHVQSDELVISVAGGIDYLGKLLEELPDLLPRVLGRDGPVREGHPVPPIRDGTIINNSGRSRIAPVWRVVFLDVSAPTFRHRVRVAPRIRWHCCPTATDGLTNRVDLNLAG